MAETGWCCALPANYITTFSNEINRVIGTDNLDANFVDVFISCTAQPCGSIEPGRKSVALSVDKSLRKYDYA